jgi:hypothetical protein
MIKKLLLALAAGATLAGSANAAVVINITGATAFRSAATAAINAAFGAANFAYGFSNTDDVGNTTNLNNGFNQIWHGTFPGIGGSDTYIRTSWNGSVEGVRALLQPGVANNASYLDTAVISALPLAAGGGTPAQRNFGANLVTAVADLAFSDVAQAATPVPGTVFGGPVGVIVFTMIANRTWKNDDAGATAGITSISDQQWRTLLDQGHLPLGFFKGNTTDTTQVYATGRNDGSGTRTQYLAETGYGISKKVNQYVGYDRSTSTLPSIVKTAQGGGFNSAGVATTTIKSTVWGNDADGNGGYNSGADIRGDMAKTTANCTVYEFFDADGSGDYTADEAIVSVATSKLYMLSWLSSSDARTARGTGTTGAATAEVLGYNGVILSGLAGNNPPATLSNGDIALVANGSYSAWGYENLFHLNTTNEQAVFTELKSRLSDQTLIGSAGVTLGNMHVNRSEDGGKILPGALP